jgi:Domain of unknown function (DUF4189)
MRVLVAALLTMITTLAIHSADAAASCSTVVSGAEPTPSPNWLSNPYPGKCYVDWSASGYVERQQLETKCRNIPGYFAFKPDSGSGRNTCIFEESASSAGTEVAPPPKPKPQASRVAPPLPWGAVAAYDDIYVWVRGSSEQEVRDRSLTTCAQRTGKKCSVVTIQPNMCVCMFTVNYMNGSSRRTQVFVRKDWMYEAACDDAYKACNLSHPGKCEPQESHCANKRF